MYRVLVLAGGISNERQISLKSGDSVSRSLFEAGYSVTMFDTKNGMEKLKAELINYDVVFPALHGQGGEDGTVQKVLEEHGIPFVGSGSQASSLCFDKYKYIKFLTSKGFKCPKTNLVNKTNFKISELLGRPFVLKPINGGSSIDMIFCHDSAKLDVNKINRLLNKYENMLIEELIIGTEITVGILNKQALPVIEISPPSNQNFDFKNKYNGKTKELIPPPNVSHKLQANAQNLALNIHRAIGCLDISRTDIIIDRNDEMYVLETNTIPGFTEQSLLPKAAFSAGVSMPLLVNELIKSALKRKKS